MAMDFPASPSVGQIFTADAKTWTWDGTSWNAVGNNTTFQAHGGTHELGGVDAITIAPSQVTGTAIVNGDVHIVTFCTSTTRPGSPTAGQIIYETDTSLYFGWNGSIWSSIGGGGAAYQSAAPSSPLAGALWVDSDAAAASLNENDFLLKADAILDQQYTLLQATMGVM
jgi:hypothetical protein